MDVTDQLRAFVATAQAGSFTGGAKQMGISNRLTSKYMAELEARLDALLFQRTTCKPGRSAAPRLHHRQQPAQCATLELYPRRPVA